jgi:hypothetical protein
MNIDIELNNYISLLSFDEKKLLLSLIKNFTTTGKNSSISKTILEYNLELEEAVQLIKNGEYIEHADVLKESKEW